MADSSEIDPPDSFISKEDGLSYWQGINADIDGMLGGIPSIKGFSGILRSDLQGSRTFLAKLGIGAKQGRQKLSSALEGGAGLVIFFFFPLTSPPQSRRDFEGFSPNLRIHHCFRRNADGRISPPPSCDVNRIGRVTEGLLLPLADEVDVIEPVAKFTKELQGKEGVRNVYNVGLQDWRPVDGVTYDLVWTQWCVGHLTDAQLVEYLERCQTVLRPGGLIVLKENLSTTGADVFDELDSSVTRLV
jgi:protein N-terminal methyltransferase